MTDPRAFDPEKIQRGACDDCTQGVMDADGPAGPGNDHYYGACKCACHVKTCPTCGGSGAVPVMVERISYDEYGDARPFGEMEPAPCPDCSGCPSPRPGNRKENSA